VVTSCVGLYEADQRSAWSIPETFRCDAQARVRLPWSDLAGRTGHLRDALNGGAFHRDGDEFQDEGLSVGMKLWESCLLSLAA
jgi:hypothetical protein